MRTSRYVVALVAAVAVIASSQAVVEQLHAQQTVADLMIRSRSQEQPQPSARRIALPQGNPLQVLQVLGNVYMIAGGPSNVTVQIGDEGVLVVDTATAEFSEHVLQAIRVLSERPISYVINTTPDRDHYSGNEKIGMAGENPTVARRDLQGAGTITDDNGGGNNPAGLRPQGAMIFAHEHLLNRMSAPTGEVPAEPFALWPTSTFFTPKKAISFNDEAVEMLYEPAAHTDADVMVVFRRSDVVVAGDVIDTRQYPFFDARRGGTIAGILDALNNVIDITVPRFNQMGGTRVVPGHGRILNEADVVEYRDMMTIVRDRVKLGVESGKTLAQIQALRPTLDYDGLYSSPRWTGAMVVEAIYTELGGTKAAPRTASLR
jgi:cyclase